MFLFRVHIIRFLECLERNQEQERLDILSDMEVQWVCLKWGRQCWLCAVRGAWETVGQVFGEMKKPGVEPDRDSFVTKVAAYDRCWSGTHSLQMYDEMIMAGFSLCTTTYNAFFNAITKVIG